MEYLEIFPDQFIKARLVLISEVPALWKNGLQLPLMDMDIIVMGMKSTKPIQSLYITTTDIMDMVIMDLVTMVYRTGMVTAIMDMDTIYINDLLNHLMDMGTIPAVSSTVFIKPIRYMRMVTITICTVMVMGTMVHIHTMITIYIGDLLYPLMAMVTAMATMGILITMDMIITVTMATVIMDTMDIILIHILMYILVNIINKYYNLIFSLLC